jgi:hypothetical protein
MKIPTIVPVLNRENRSNKNGKYSIHLRITLDRTSKYINIPLPQKVSTAKSDCSDPINPIQSDPLNLIEIDPRYPLQIEPSFLFCSN